MVMSSLEETWRRSYFWKRRSDLFLEAQSIRGRLAPIVLIGRIGLLPNRWFLSTWTLRRQFITSRRGEIEVNIPIHPNLLLNLLIVSNFFPLFCSMWLDVEDLCFLSVIWSFILHVSWYVGRFWCRLPFPLNQGSEINTTLVLYEVFVKSSIVCYVYLYLKREKRNSDCFYRFNAPECLHLANKFIGRSILKSKVFN